MTGTPIQENEGHGHTEQHDYDNGGYPDQEWRGDAECEQDGPVDRQLTYQCLHPFALGHQRNSSGKPYTLASILS